MTKALGRIGDRGRRSMILGLLIVATTGAVPATAAAAPPRNGWVGTVRGTRAFVGLVVRGQSVRAYVCDGRRVARWYTGLVSHRRATLRDARGRRLGLRIAGRSATGTVDLPGHRRAHFTARRARGRAGTFRRETARRSSGKRAARQTVDGWVRLNDGRVRGLAVAQTVRVRDAAAGLQVLLRPVAADTAVGPPASGPRLDDRVLPSLQDGPCVSVPRPLVNGHRPPAFASGPTCGLPASGMDVDASSTTARVKSRPAGVPLTAVALDRLKDELPALRAREQARELAGTGLPSLPPTLPTPDERARLDAAAKAMVGDRILTAAATAVRLLPTGARGAALSALIAKYFKVAPRRLITPEIGVRDIPGPVGPIKLFDERTLTGPFAMLEEKQLDGGDAEVTDTQQFGVLGDALVFGNLARAGFNSSAEARTYALLDISVPAGTRRVQIATDASRSPQHDTQRGCLGGAGYWQTGMLISVYAMGSDGVYHVDGAPADGIYAREEFDDSLNLPIIPLLSCWLTPPSPSEPTFYNSLDEFPTLHIGDVPAAGGRYLLMIESHTLASTVMDGQATSDHMIEIRNVTVRTSRF